MADELANLTVEILKQIRDGVQKTNERIDALALDTSGRLQALTSEVHATNERLDRTNERLDRTNERLDRVDQGLNDLGQFMRQIALDQSKHERFHHHHVDKLEENLRELEERVAKLESGAATRT